MKYKNYEITRDDERNWKLERTDMVLAKSDIRNPKTGKVIYPKGSVYEKVTFKGFFGNVGSALAKIVDDCAGVDCADITALSNQLGEIKASLKELTKLK
jgi:hypothetical protein